jgi:predicted glycoside hydrolase/deacetylase ChbG (UPF0249 family)
MLHGFNEFVELSYQFSPSAVHCLGDAPPEEHGHYHTHCFPEVKQIVAHVCEVRALLLPAMTLTRMFIVTNESQLL